MKVEQRSSRKNHQSETTQEVFLDASRDKKIHQFGDDDDEGNELGVREEKENETIVVILYYGFSKFGCASLCLAFCKVHDFVMKHGLSEENHKRL